MFETRTATFVLLAALVGIATGCVVQHEDTGPQSAVLSEGDNQKDVPQAGSQPLRQELPPSGPGLLTPCGGHGITGCNLDCPPTAQRNGRSYHLVRNTCAQTDHCDGTCHYVSLLDGSSKTTPCGGDECQGPGARSCCESVPPPCPELDGYKVVPPWQCFWRYECTGSCSYEAD